MPATSADVLGQRLLAVDREVRERSVSVILRSKFCGGGFEMREVLGCPPVADAALGVKHAALGIEGVTDFVTYHGTNGAIVTAAGASGSKNGGWRIAAGKLSAFCSGRFTAFTVCGVMDHSLRSIEVPRRATCR